MNFVGDFICCVSNMMRTVRSSPNASYDTGTYSMYRRRHRQEHPDSTLKATHAIACAALSSSVAHPKPNPVASRRKGR